MVSIEDANLKFLRSLPSVWHVVATMIRGQPGLDELDFDDLYNNLKVILLESVDLLNIPGKQSIGRNEMRQHEDIDCDQGFDAVNTDDDQYSLALMATISEVPYCSKGSMSYKKLLKALKLKVPSPKEDLLFHQQYLKGNGFDKNSSSYHLQLLSRRESSTKFHDYASLTVDALDSMTGDRTCCLILKEFKGGYVALDMTSKVFKNQLMNRVCAKKGIKSDIAHCQDSHRQMVLQKERTVYIEEVVRCRDSLLPIQFWAEAVNTACYVLNRVLGRQLCLIQRTRNVCDDVEDLDDHIFIVQYSFAYASGGTLCAKEVSLSSEEQSLHEEDCIRVMTSRSLAKLIMMIKRIAFERIRGDISCKGKEQILMMIIQKLVFSLQTLLMLGRRVADYNKMDPTIDVPSDSPAL
ncbi:hypothetical protein Tco_0624034 [Tanacetum coccineum]|uniref:Uncharacterized protein n=1 Tax=Tanacetum coccineum TaxID=301880 RepID=A0ABQ4WCP0_9ASTR